VYETVGGEIPQPHEGSAEQNFCEGHNKVPCGPLYSNGPAA